MAISNKVAKAVKKGLKGRIRTMEEQIAEIKSAIPSDLPNPKPSKPKPATLKPYKRKPPR